MWAKWARSRQRGQDSKLESKVNKFHISRDRTGPMQANSFIGLIGSVSVMFAYRKIARLNQVYTSTFNYLLPRGLFKYNWHTIHTRIVCSLDFVVFSERKRKHLSSRRSPFWMSDDSTYGRLDSGQVDSRTTRSSDKSTPRHLDSRTTRPTSEWTRMHGCLRWIQVGVTGQG